MSERSSRSGGSRFLYEPFDANAARIEAHERVTEERWTALEYRLGQIETALDRLERRMWLSVSGIAAFLATDVVYAIISKIP
ncbi:GTA head formation protein, RCAP_rcc01685 family [Halovulum sp. GXIMD14793]